MRDPRINTFAALGIVFLFGLGACGLILHAIVQVDWMNVSQSEAALGS